MYQCYDGFYKTPCGDFRKSFSSDTLNYWERSFFQRCRSLIEFEGLPEAAEGQIGWDYDAFLFQLLCMGYAVVFNSRKYGIVVQPGTPSGFGLQYEPRGMQISTPFFQFDRPLEIGTECAVIKLTPDYRGVWDIIEKYAVEMQHAEVAIRQAQINSRFAYAAVVNNDKQKKTVDAIFQQLENGKPAVVVNSELKRPMGDASADWQLPIMQFDRDLSKNFILPDLFEARRTILTDFYRELGVRVQPDKKERMVVNESQSADAETFNRREVWRISIDKSLDVCNTMFGTHITFKINEPPELTEGDGEESEVGENADVSRNSGK